MKIDRDERNEYYFSCELRNLWLLILSRKGKIIIYFLFFSILFIKFALFFMFFVNSSIPKSI